MILAKNGGMKEIIEVFSSHQLLDGDLKEVKAKDIGDLLYMISQDKFRIESSRVLVRGDLSIRDHTLTGLKVAAG